MTDMSTPPVHSRTSDASAFTLFARQAEATPDAIAALTEQGPIRYAELARRAAAVCHHLRSRGLAAEQPVGVLMHRDADLLAVLLGIWQAGGCWVPFDPQDPPSRVLRLLAACGSDCLVGSPVLLQAVTPQAHGRPLPALVDASRIAPAPNDAGACESAPGGTHLAYLLFTSGSTGEPKAVEVEHHGVLNLLMAARELLGFDASDRYLAVATVAFDIAVAELFLPLVCGGSLVLRDRALLLQPQQLAREVRAQGVTVLQTGPSVWQMLLAEVPDFPRVRVAISTGEAVAPELARRLAGCADQAWNLYGPTEATVWATGHRLSPDDASPYSAGSAPIGRPLAGLTAVVVDAQLQPLHDDTPGELLIGGAGVARGYRGHPALTQQRFITLPDGQRCYRSGDLVVRDASGVLHYLGRNDEQLKVRGVRIEPAEVESALLADARVAQAAVTWFDTGGSARAVVAAVVLRPGAVLSARELHDALAKQLPSQMIPARFLFVPWLPMTVSGKVDRRAIREAVALPPAQPADMPAEPQLSDTEKQLGGIWQRMLGLERVQPGDHFFSIGGDSLAAVQMMVEAEALFGLDLHVQTVFEAPTLHELAAKIDAARQRPAPLRNTDFVFPLVQMNGARPLFFCDINLSMARRGAWAVPCPLYAVSSWARGSGFVQADSLSALVAVHIEGIRRVQPNGPYRIGGFSKGGLIAYELAQQLQRQGEVVELLFLLDPTHPRRTTRVDTVQRWATKHRPLSERFAGRLKRIVRGPGERGFRPWLQDIVPYSRFPPLQWAIYQLVHLYGRHPNPISQKLLPRNRWPAFWFAAKKMMKEYVAEPYAGPVLAVFTAHDYAAGGAWPALLGPQAQTRVLQTGHEHLFAEDVGREWMALLSRRLQALDTALR
jgi:enterobactin synthetase component F